MATIDSREMIDKLIANDGYYEDDPRVLAIHSYMNNWGARTYHVAWQQAEIDSLYSSPFCTDIKLIWSRKRNQ